MEPSEEGADDVSGLVPHAETPELKESSHSVTLEDIGSSDSAAISAVVEVPLEEFPGV